MIGIMIDSVLKSLYKTHFLNQFVFNLNSFTIEASGRGSTSSFK